uniref:Transposase Tc1-like domain-containing protein n=1 Tax=Phytophthora ramorum TaxID=164328 RepID=H3GLK1_PHYRM
MLQRFHHVDLQRRTTIRAAVASGVPSTTLFRCLKQAKLRSYKNVTRPMLTVDSLKARIKFCLADTSINKYRDMMDMVHVDHKYFFLTVVKRRFIILHDEPEPTRKLKKKRHIMKVMMLAAVARLRYNAAEELVSATTEAYWKLPEETLNNIFLSLQCAVESCIREQGENTYKLAHMEKAKLRREGRLPWSIPTLSRLYVR